MRRRDFLIGGAAAAWPMAARAQRATIPVIGFLGAATASAWSVWVAAFAQRVGERGWSEGRTIKIDYRWAEGRTERYSEIAAEFVRLKVDVIVAPITPVALAAKQATSAIPIVFALIGDPTGTGLVASLARPGGNVTGVSNQSNDFAGKRLQLLGEIIPGLRRLAILANVNNSASVLEMAEARKAGQTLGLEVVNLEIRRAEDIAAVLEELKDRIDALYVPPDALLFLNRIRINTLALSAKVPTVYSPREYVEAGGFMSYGPSYPDQFRRAADYADKILRGAKPADLPVQQPTKFDFVINLQTAKLLGLTVSPTLLARADEVIE